MIFRTAGGPYEDEKIAPLRLPAVTQIVTVGGRGLPWIDK
jgi:hypothetical protein